MLPFATMQQDGVAKVSFYCSEEGRPSRVTLFRSSGEYAFDRAALHAVSRIKTLHPLAAGIDHHQRYAAVVIFAATPGSLAATQQRLAKEQQMAANWLRSVDGKLAMVGPIPANAR